MVIKYSDNDLGDDGANNKITATKTNEITTDEGGREIDINVKQVLTERYLSYALSTITSRSLPDVRDGLKPVQRRILYAMYTSGNRSDKPHKKSANAVGYVMMHYHPHGDSSIYDALVRMSQDFVMRYPLIDGQGNFGSIDGDNAAAFRYTEAKLHKIAETLMENIGYDTVDLRPNYNDQKMEPVVLPAILPNILLNGASGIAVGMATNIPPHNINEVVDAILLLLKNPASTINDLCTIIKGPDFPTGGNMPVNDQQIIDLYTSGKGSIVLQCKFHTEDNNKIVITEIPYAVQKMRILEQLGAIVENKDMPFITDIMDESDDKIRIVIYIKNLSHKDFIMSYLYKHSELENRVNVNLNVLDKDRVPKVMNLKEILCAFIEHRIEVLVRATKYRLNTLDKRLNIVKGLLIIHVHIDEVIRIIRHEDNPEAIIMAKYKLNVEQVDAILEMKLKALKKIEFINLKKEEQVLIAKIEEQKNLLNNKNNQIVYIINELSILKDKFADLRRTSIVLPTANKNPSIAMIDKKITIICSKLGWIKAINDHMEDHTQIKYKEGDQERFILHTNTKSKLCIVTNIGKCYTVDCYKINISNKGFGTPISIYCDFQKDESIINIFNIVTNEVETQLPVDNSKNDLILFVSNRAKGMMVKQNDLISYTKYGKSILKIDIAKSNETLIFCNRIKSQNCVAISSDNRKVLIMPANTIPIIKQGKGVRLKKYISGQTVCCDIKILEDDKTCITWQKGSRNYKVEDNRLWFGKRGAVGKTSPFGFPKNNKFSI